MTKCAYCKDKITLAPLGFSGLDGKFCQSCWHKIYNVYSGLQRLEQEPQILKFVLKIH